VEELRDEGYATWVGDEDFDVERIAEAWRVIPRQVVDFANKLLSRFRTSGLRTVVSRRGR
jgi:hypothetical protein